MSVFRSVVALLGGFAIMVMLVLVLVALAAWATGVGTGEPTPVYLALNLLVSAFAAAAGGYSTAALAPQKPRAHTVGLAVMILVMAASQLGRPQPGQPAWYPAALTVIGPLFALIGGTLRRPRVRPASPP